MGSPAGTSFAIPSADNFLYGGRRQVLNPGSRGRGLLRLAAQLAVVAALVCLAIANMYVRATWSEMEDGVLWRAGADGVVAQEIASGSPAAKAGIRAGDILEEIDGRPVESSTGAVISALHAASRGTTLSYTIVRVRTQEILKIAVAPIPSGARGLYYVLAAVGLFSLFVGAGVRFGRRENQATLHFFWLTIAFFGMLAFS